MKTPVGRFRIAEKIGAGEATNIAYKSREPFRASAKTLRTDDLVMSRILWLDGLERTNANTFDRYIYIHGTNHEEQIGSRASHGCIRMRTADVAELFDLVRSIARFCRRWRWRRRGNLGRRGARLGPFHIGFDDPAAGAAAGHVRQVHAFVGRDALGQR